MDGFWILDYLVWFVLLLVIGYLLYDPLCLLASLLAVTFVLSAWRAAVDVLFFQFWLLGALGLCLIETWGYVIG